MSKSKEHADIVRDASKFHESLGRCLNSWQSVEENLFLLSWSLGLHQAFGWASVFFTHLRAFDKKCSLVDKLAGLTLQGKPELKEWKTLLGRLERAAQTRDKLVHYGFFYGNDHQFRIQIPFHSPPIIQEKYGPHATGHAFGTGELARIEEDFETLINDLMAFNQKTRPIARDVRRSLIEKDLRQDGLLSDKETLAEALSRLLPITD